MTDDQKAREYRKNLGFSNQDNLKSYFKAKDIRDVNWEKVEKLNERLRHIFFKLNSIINSKYMLNDEEMAVLYEKHNCAYKAMREQETILQLNNNGRSEESVYYSWMRGFLAANFFTKAISAIFCVGIEEIEQLGSDNIMKVAEKKDRSCFVKDSSADLKIVSKGVHIEVQTGFAGLNDIKKSKVTKACLRFEQEKYQTYILHFDIFNGRLAVINISNLSNLMLDWRANKQFEGVETIKIPDELFLWCLEDELPNDILSLSNELCSLFNSYKNSD